LNFHALIHTEIVEYVSVCDYSLIRGYTMDVICQTGFGLDVSAQTDPDNPFIINAKRIFEQKPAKNPMLLFSCMYNTVY